MRVCVYLYIVTRFNNRILGIATSRNKGFRYYPTIWSKVKSEMNRIQLDFETIINIMANDYKLFTILCICTYINISKSI